MENWSEHIDDYINGNLKGQTLERFKYELERNETLQKAVQNYDVAKKLSAGLLEVDLWNTLAGFENDHSVEKDDRRIKNDNRSSLTDLDDQKKSNWIYKFALAAAIIGVLLMGAWWIHKNSEKAKFKQYVLNNYEKPIDEEATKSVDTIGMAAFEKGKFYFALNRFQESEEWLKNALESTSSEEEKSEIYYWLGCAHIEQWEVEEAKQSWKFSNNQESKLNLNLIEIK